MKISELKKLAPLGAVKNVEIEEYLLTPGYCLVITTQDKKKSMLQAFRGHAKVYKTLDSAISDLQKADIRFQNLQLKF
jgi:hypothetical protein